MSAEEDEIALFASIRFSPIATVVTDPSRPDNPIQAVNSAFEALTGYARDELIGRNCRLLLGPDSDPRARELLRAAISEVRAAMVEIVNYRRDGSPFRNAVMIAPLFNEEGELAYFIGSQMDVSSGAAGGPGGAGVRAAAARSNLQALTIRQREVLEQMARGLRNKQIAAQLDISEKTVKMHRAALLSRLGAATSADAVRLAVEAGL